MTAGTSQEEKKAYDEAQKMVKAVRDEACKDPIDTDRLANLIHAAEASRKWYETVATVQRLERERQERRGRVVGHW